MSNDTGIKVVLMFINGSWWSFRGITSTAWRISMDENEIPWINQNDGKAIFGSPVDVMYG